MKFEQIIEHELEARQQVKEKVLELVLQEYQAGKGSTGRREVQQYVYSSLGFHGLPGNEFDVFVNKVLSEHGFRITMRDGYNVYGGLVKREKPCQDQQVSKKPSIENAKQ